MRIVLTLALMSAAAQAVAQKAHADDGTAVPSSRPALSRPAAKTTDALIARLRSYVVRLFAHHTDGEGTSNRREPTALLAELRGLSDADLEDVFRALWARRGGGFELCLTEIIRRGGQRWETVLKAGLKAERSGEPLAGTPPASRPTTEPLWRVVRDLELLTALRRVQKRHDPVVILFPGRRSRNCKLGYLPSLRVLLTNLDELEESVAITAGGSNRGNRPNRWRFEVRDEKGNILLPKEGVCFGGISMRWTLKYGESWTTQLRMADHVDVDVPGEYTVRIQYHDHVWLGDVAETTGLICCQSIPFELTVRPIEVTLSAAERKRCTELIAALPAKGSLRILGGAYPEEGNTFLPPDSPAGGLRKLDWKAVPSLIRAANNTKLHEVQRAWALALLFSISGRHDPRRAPGVIGPYEYRHSGWITFGGETDGGASMSFSSGSESIHIGRIDAAKQLAFAKRWLPWIEKGYVRLIEK